MSKIVQLTMNGDYENIRSLHTRGTISEHLAHRLAKCNGLANVLIHQYNGIDDERVIDSISEVEEDLRALIRVVEVHLGEH